MGFSFDKIKNISKDQCQLFKLQNKKNQSIKIYGL